MPPPDASPLSHDVGGRPASRRAWSWHKVADEMRGGVASAAVALGILLPLGLLPYAALGAEGAAIGTRAAFVASIVGGVIIALVGGAAIPGSGPRTSTALIFA